jgi:hypothetical protein
LTPEQVAAARAYVLNHPETVLDEHLEIETRMSAGNPPEVIEKARETHATFLRFKEWLDRREAAAARESRVEMMSGGGRNGSRRFSTFKEWLAE